MAHKYFITLIGTLLLLSWTAAAGGNDYLNNIEIRESGINIDHQQFPASAYLNLTLKNGGDKKISHLTFEIKYFDEDDNLIMKAVVNNSLGDALSPRETQKLKIRLKGNIVHVDNAQYPYDRSSKVDGYDIKILNVKFASK
jgi:hypothetical protein